MKFNIVMAFELAISISFLFFDYLIILTNNFEISYLFVSDFKIYAEKSRNSISFLLNKDSLSFD